MATEAKNTNYWISSTALYIQLNSMGEPDYIQCSVVSGASVLCYMSDVPGLGYDAGHNYQRWTLAAYPSIFPDSERKYVYIAIPRQSTTDNNQATVVFPGEKIDIYGKTIPSSGTEGVQIGNEAYYYIFTGGIISAVKTDADNTRKREWEQHFDCGKLATDEAIASGGEGAWWRYNSVSDTITFLKEILKANFNELSAKVARVTSLFLGGHELKGVADSNGTLETSNDTVVTPQYLGQFGVKHFLAKDKDDTAYGTITWEKVQKFFSGLLIGNSNNENGGSWTTDAEGRSHLITDYLEVRMKAIFEELVINKTSTIGGKEIISPAGGVVAHKVEEVTVTYNNVSQKAYRCYFLAEQDGDEVDNDFAVNDQVRSESFNVRKGTYHKAGNHFYWRLVIGRDEDPVELEGKKYHYIDLSDTDCATASDVPAKGDVLNQCGNRTDVERQNCLIFSSVDTYSPSISLYHGINSYSFANREYVEYGVNKQTNKAFFNVYGDMYVGDRPTKENGYEGSSYIRYDSSTKQLSVKGKISAKSTVDGKELSQYIKENTDNTVANEAKKAAEDAQKAAQTAQTNITNLGNTVTGNKKEFDNYVTNGYLEPSEIAAMAQDSKRLEDDFAAAQKSYNEVKNAEVLKDTKELTNLNTAFATLTSAKTELVTYLSEISTNYNKADTNGKAAIVSAVGTKFTNFQSAYSAFYDKLGLANAYITRKIYGDLGVVIGDVTSLAYLKKALMDAPDTEINGGLVLTSLIGLRDTGGNTTAGINGITEKSAKGGGIAAWFGGEMVDKDYNDGSKTPANTIFRFDGSGYVAGGAIWWGTDGKVHADPTSFIISEKNLGAYLTFFEPTWKAGSAGTSVADLVSLKPNAPFSKLGVSGDATFEGAISFHGIKLTYDSTNKAIKIDGNLYTTGGITAYGAGASTTGGGGLIASVISYARILEGSYTDADLTSIPNAYAIKALSSRIDNIATELGGLNLSWNNITGKPSTFTPSAHTHKWTEITDRITKVSQLTNDKGYLTAHQSLASYYTKAEIDAKGYTTNKGTVTSVALTLPTGLTCETKTITTSGTFAISLASGYSIPTTTKQTAWDGAVSAKHTHSNKSVLDGITSTKVTCWDSAYDWYALITTDEETADGVINKWNEVVSFLANIAQTDTLSGIVDGINKSISDEVTRAKKAEGVNASGISTNKTSITTLQGYFTSGSAKKALQLTNTRKLWGNSFNGTADINGSIIVPDGKYISIGNIKLEYDATNKALKITNTTTNEVANLYTSGGVSAYGVGTSSSSGGGLNGSVKSYSNALKLTSESLSEIASAYSIKALDSRISSLEGGSATAISVSGSGNAVTSVTKNGTTISVVKGSTFLTSHQSLDGYVNAISVSGSGNAITSVSKSGKSITFTKGATFLTSHQSLANYYTKSSVDTLLSGKSATSHTHSVKINGVTKTIAATGGTAVDLGTYLTSHQSLNGYATQSWVKSQGYLTSHQDVSILNMANDRYYTNNAYGINMRNSDIIGVNSVYTQDLSDSPTEAILFCRSNGNYDGIRAANGVLYFSNNVVRTTSKYDAEYEVYHKGNLTKLSQLTNDKNFVTGSVSGQTITINGVSTTWQNTWRGITDSYSGTSTGTSLSQKGANSLYNALHNGYASSAGNADTLDGYHANGSNVAPYGHIPTIESDGVMEVGKYIDFHNDNSGKHDFSTRLQTTGNYGNSVNLPSNYGTLALTSDNVASATKLQTPRTIWGQSFDGTGNVNGTIYINNQNSSNGAIRLNNDVNSNARISAIDNQVIFNTGAAIRFGETAWDWNQWAGLKYTHSNKTIHLGIADGSAFYANSPQNDGTLKFPGITTITPDAGARIGGSGGDLYLGNANNVGWVKVQNICSQLDSDVIHKWFIDEDGNCNFTKLRASAIIYTTPYSNKFNVDLPNWDGSIGANVTNMFNGIPYDNISIEYSQDNGASWHIYTTDPSYRFNLVNDNTPKIDFKLGNNYIVGNTAVDKKNQIKKNQLRVTIKIPNEIYQELSWISVDVGNDININCEVYIGDSNGNYSKSTNKVIKGNNRICDICVGPLNVNVGNNTYRYVRLVFSHHGTIIFATRNGIVSKIRGLALTKHRKPGDRYNISTTGHIYDYDYNMNTYFPNSILAKGGVTAYQSSDIRLKQDLRKLDYLCIIKAMGGTYGFAWKKDNTKSIGWIAQHVLCNPHLKDIVETDEKGYYKINYWSPKLIATAFGAIEQVGDEVSRLKARVVFLESEVLRLSGDKEDCNKKRLDNKNINSLN